MSSGKRLQYKKMQKIWNTYHPEDPIKKGSGYVIHHKNEDPSNNDPDNLRKMTRKAHTILHLAGNPISEETKRKISEARKGKYAGKNHPCYGKYLSEKTKKKMSESMKGRIPWNKGLRGVKYANSK